MSTQTACRISGRDKAAMLLLAIGPARSAEVLSRLDPAEVAAVSQRFARLPDLDDTNRNRLMAEFARLATEVGPDPPPARLREARPPTDCGLPREAAPDRQTVRDFDLSKLERLPLRAVPVARSARPHDPERFADLPVRCRAELAAIELPLAALAGLGVGDVLVLGHEALPEIEFVGGEGLRLAGRLSTDGERMAVEIVSA